ncbi:MAG: hypothetical protein DYG88_02680 [Chloroflexi bacterium CFX4]|nr:hypothetical protein [Chloroflexi bacterium CFX4]MDL1922557.1 hypothetical protein [Chloroflexi bacterium CFX3]
MDVSANAPAKAAEKTPTNGAHADSPPRSVQERHPPRPKRRRWLSIGLTLIAAFSLFACGALIGYTQGPPLATLIASGQSFVQLGTEFQACFTAASNDSGVRSFFSLFARGDRPTRTPGPSPTLDPSLLRVVKGELVALNQREVTVQTVSGSRERFPLIPLAQVVSPSGSKLSAQGILVGDSINILAIRLSSLGGFGALIGAAGGQGTPQPLSDNDYAAFCVIVDVNPK